MRGCVAFNLAKSVDLSVINLLVAVARKKKRWNRTEKEKRKGVLNSFVEMEIRRSELLCTVEYVHEHFTL